MFIFRHNHQLRSRLTYRSWRFRQNGSFGLPHKFHSTANSTWKPEPASRFPYERIFVRQLVREPEELVRLRDRISPRRKDDASVSVSAANQGGSLQPVGIGPIQHLIGSQLGDGQGRRWRGDGDGVDRE